MDARRHVVAGMGVFGMKHLITLVFLTLLFTLAPPIFAQTPGTVSVSPAAKTWITTPNQIIVKSPGATQIFYTVENTYDGSSPKNPIAPTPWSPNYYYDGILDGPTAALSYWGFNGQYRQTKLLFIGCNSSGCGPVSSVYTYGVNMVSANSALFWGWKFEPSAVGPLASTDHVYGRARIYNKLTSTQFLDFSSFSGAGIWGVYRAGEATCCFYNGGFGHDEPFPWDAFSNEIQGLVIAPGRSRTIDFITETPGSYTPPPGNYSVQANIQIGSAPQWYSEVPTYIKNTLTWSVEKPQPTNYGLFIGAYDPRFRWDLLNIVDFSRNAGTMATAFAARPNTKAYVLTGDLSLDSNGNQVDPITLGDIQRKLRDIRSQMRSEDTLTLYINNHGGSAVPGSTVTDTGIGDEIIYVGDYLWDNQLAEELVRFDGLRVMVFLDTCHGGGFWGGSDLKESPPEGLGFNDLNQLNNIALYSGAAEDKKEYALGRWSFWGLALLEAFQTPIIWSPSGLASFLEERTLEIADDRQEAPVWYTLGPGDPVLPDSSLIQTFDVKSADFNNAETFLAGPEPLLQFDSLIAAVEDTGPGKSLFNKMVDAKAYYEVGDDVAACETLKAFIHEVNAQTGKKISLGDAESIIASAVFTMAAIGCY